MANMTVEQMQAEIDRLKAENARISQSKVQALSFKVSEKGGVSVYGLGRFPTTLYGAQWVRLLACADRLRDFIKANESSLSTK